jgi:lipoprotein NlpD
MLQSARNHLRYTIFLASILTILFLLLACSSPPAVDISDSRNSGYNRGYSADPKKLIGKIHIVQASETLYSIAWRYGLNYQDLARFNGINPPFTIHAAQQIRLSAAASKTKTVVQSGSGLSDIKARTKPVKTIVVQPKANSENNVKVQNRSEYKTKQAELSPSNSAAPSTLKWQWPASGKLLAQFQADTGLNKGIDLGGKLGEPVIAAAAGQVVYSGSGLRGYGKLLIIKHNEIFLSAYAHNDKLLVQEGDLVKVGQRIADMGSTGAARVQLHFEIRSAGKPVNPLAYLPKR